MKSKLIYYLFLIIPLMFSCDDAVERKTIVGNKLIEYQVNENDVLRTAVPNIENVNNILNQISPAKVWIPRFSEVTYENLNTISIDAGEDWQYIGFRQDSLNGNAPVYNGGRVSFSCRCLIESGCVPYILTSDISVGGCFLVNDCARCALTLEGGISGGVINVYEYGGFINLNYGITNSFNDRLKIGGYIFPEIMELPETRELILEFSNSNSLSENANIAIVGNQIVLEEGYAFKNITMFGRTACVIVPKSDIKFAVPTRKLNIATNNSENIEIENINGFLVVNLKDESYARLNAIGFNLEIFRN